MEVVRGETLCTLFPEAAEQTHLHVAWKLTVRKKLWASS